MLAERKAEVEAEDAFHVVCPSLPGYGFSAAAKEPGMSPRRVAERHAATVERIEIALADGTGELARACVRNGTQAKVCTAAW